MTVLESIVQSPESLAEELAEAQANGALFAIERFEGVISSVEGSFTENQLKFLRALMQLLRSELHLQKENDRKDWLVELSEKEDPS